jgi:hypothetical protein
MPVQPKTTMKQIQADAYLQSSHETSVYRAATYPIMFLLPERFYDAAFLFWIREDIEEKTPCPHHCAQSAVTRLSYDFYSCCGMALPYLSRNVK